jgi:hypothetical protein
MIGDEEIAVFFFLSEQQSEVKRRAARIIVSK